MPQHIHVLGKASLPSTYKLALNVEQKTLCPSVSELVNNRDNKGTKPLDSEN